MSIDANSTSRNNWSDAVVLIMGADGNVYQIESDGTTVTNLGQLPTNSNSTTGNWQLTGPVAAALSSQTYAAEDCTASSPTTSVAINCYVINYQLLQSTSNNLYIQGMYPPTQGQPSTTNFLQVEFNSSGGVSSTEWNTTSAVNNAILDNLASAVVQIQGGGFIVNLGVLANNPNTPFGGPNS